MPLLAILVLAAASNQDAIQLTQKSQVKELCEALRAQPSESDLDPAQAAAARKAAQATREDAASRWYRVEVPSLGFAFGRYHSQEQQLELDGDRPLRALEDALTLDLDGTNEVAFNARPEQVTAWTAERKAKTLRLVVEFKPSGERCAGSAAAESWRIAGHARSWELMGAKGALASANEDNEPVGGGPRQLRVERITLESDSAPHEGDARRLSAVQSSLNSCATGAQRGGKLVLTFSVQGGRIRDPQVVLDSVRDERVSACVARAIAGADVGGSGPGTAAISLQ